MLEYVNQYEKGFGSFLSDILHDILIADLVLCVVRLACFYIYFPINLIIFDILINKYTNFFMHEGLTNFKFSKIELKIMCFNNHVFFIIIDNRDFDFCSQILYIVNT